MLRRRSTARATAAAAAAALACAACSSSDPPVTPDGPPGEDAMPDAPLVLDPTPGTYRQTCDGSGAVALDFDHFLDLNDENQGARIYRRGADAVPVQEVDLSGALGLAAGDEGDLEDVAQFGGRLYIISSHGRNTSGALRPVRYRFGAVDVTGAPPAVTLTPAGSTTQLLQGMLAAANWDTPNTAVIAALEASSQLGTQTAAQLAPENQGTNIEGLAARGTEVLIGFRNPRPAGRAIVVRLANPSAVIAGGTPRFVSATTLDLGGLGIRGMTHSNAHAAVLILAGPHDGAAGPFRIYKWSGELAEPPVAVADITAPAQSAPEAIVAYPGTKDVQVVFDQGDFVIGGNICKEAPAGDRRFVDAIYRVN